MKSYQKEYGSFLARLEKHPSYKKEPEPLQKCRSPKLIFLLELNNIIEHDCRFIIKDDFVVH